MTEEFYKNKICIITGGTGFVGRNIVNELLKYKTKQIIIFDRTIKYQWNDTRIVYLEANLLKDLNILLNYDFNLVFHEAANVDTTCIDNDNMLNTNYNSFKELINICEIKNAKLIYASSAATYGNSDSPNIVGIGEVPLNIYGQSKLLMDNYVRENKNNFKIPVIGIRYFNVYGPGESHKSKMMSMISQIINTIKNKEDVKLFEFGEQKRDFVYVKDIAHCNILCGLYNKSDIFNCGFGKSVSYNEIFKFIKDKFNSNSKVIYIPQIYKFFQTNTIADISKTTELLNYTPNFNIYDGIEDYINL